MKRLFGFLFQASAILDRMEKRLEAMSPELLPADAEDEARFWAEWVHRRYGLVTVAKLKQARAWWRSSGTLP